MRGLVIWLPMLAGDDDAAAFRQAQAWQEVRVQHWWDGRRYVSQDFARVLGLEIPAWDVYLLYPPGVPWKGVRPPAPSFWMHQLAGPGADPALLLCDDPGRLTRELDALSKE